MVAMKQKTDRHCFDKAQIISSDYLVPLETGLIYMHYGQYANAQQRINAAITKQPDAFHNWYLLGRCQENTGRQEAAIQSYEQCVQLCPNHQEAGTRLAHLAANKWSLGRILSRLIPRH